MIFDLSNMASPKSIESALFESLGKKRFTGATENTFLRMVGIYLKLPAQKNFENVSLLNCDF